VISHVRLVNVEVPVDQFGRTERGFVREVDAAAASLHRLALEHDLAGDVALGVHVVLTLDVNAGADCLQHVDGIGRLVDRHPIDVGQRCQHLGAQALREHGPAGPLVDEAVRRNGDHQDVAQFSRRLEVADMAHMEKVEGAVRVHDGLA
jgi:hypothetical protein